MRRTEACCAPGTARAHCGHRPAGGAERRGRAASATVATCAETGLSPAGIGPAGPFTPGHAFWGCRKPRGNKHDVLPRISVLQRSSITLNIFTLNCASHELEHKIQLALKRQAPRLRKHSLGGARQAARGLPSAEPLPRRVWAARRRSAQSECAQGSSKGPGVLTEWPSGPRGNTGPEHQNSVGKEERSGGAPRPDFESPARRSHGDREGRGHTGPGTDLAQGSPLAFVCADFQQER